LERIIHANDNAREAKATVWIFEGTSLFFLIVAFALALLGYRFCYDRLGLGTWGSLAVAVVPLVLVTTYVVTLKLRKPKSYDLDFFRSLAMRLFTVLARMGLLFIRLDLHGFGTRKTQHPYSK
jgi:hypothetical protein